MHKASRILLYRNPRFTLAFTVHCIYTDFQHPEHQNHSSLRTGKKIQNSLSDNLTTAKHFINPQKCELHHQRLETGQSIPKEQMHSLAFNVRKSTSYYYHS